MKGVKYWKRPGDAGGTLLLGDDRGNVNFQRKHIPKLIYVKHGRSGNNFEYLRERTRGRNLLILRE